MEKSSSKSARCIQNMKHGSDASSFFLFEASGDSEGDLNHLHESERYWQNLFAVIFGGSVVAVADDDDAESCNCESGGVLGVRDETAVSNFNYHAFRDGEGDGDGDDGKCDYSCRTEAFFGCRTPGISGREEGEEESGLGVGVHGRRVQTDDEMEKDRLFWEACLRVGLPNE